MKYNKVNIGPIVPFILFLLGMLAICIVGVSNVFAATTQYWGPTITQPKQAYFYDCNSSDCTTDYTSSNGIGYDSSGNEYGIYWAYDINTVANSYGAMAVIRPDTALLKDKIYSTTVYMCSESSYIVPINLYSGSLSQIQSRSYPTEQLTGWGNADLGSNYPYARIELGDAISNPVINNCRAVSFIYTPEVNSTYIGFQFTTGSTVTNNQYLIGYQHEYLGDYNSLSEEQVDTIINNQTTEINTNITNMQESLSSDIQNTEDNINSNIDDMEDSIVESNKETQEVIKDQFNDCRDSYNLLKFSLASQSINGLNITNNGDGTLTLNGTTNDTISLQLSQTMYNLSAGNYYYTLNPSGSVSDTFTKILYGRNDTTVEIIHTTENNKGAITSVDYNSYYFWIYIKSGITFTNYTIKPMLNEGTVAQSWEPYGEEICSNKIDETNDKLDNIQGALTDDSSVDMSGLGDTAGWLPAGPVDSIINIPLTLLNTLSTSLSGSCVPLTMTIPFVNKSFTFPCMSELLMKIDGFSTFWSWLGAIASVIILYKYLMNLYAWVDNILMMRVELDEAMGCDMANWGRL